ncbi:MAG TPA: RNA polymerase sigma factor [Flavipsychrobacter sp.]|nr:RNA polymerase sigma factor [Flavipsychrobacter sp.]
MSLEYSEAEIIAGCQKGDRTMQEVLYRRHYSEYLKLCLRYASCEPDAKQIMNDAFFKIFSRIDQYNFDGPLGAWIRRIVVNTCLDHVKQKMRRERKERAMDNDQLHLATSDRGSFIIDNLSFNEIIKHIQELPEKHRAVFNMSVFEGMSHKEIADELEMSHGTSQWYLSKAKEMLRMKLSPVKLKTL